MKFRCHMVPAYGAALFSFEQPSSPASVDSSEPSRPLPRRLYSVTDSTRAGLRSTRPLPCRPPLYSASPSPASPLDGLFPAGFILVGPSSLSALSLPASSSPARARRPRPRRPSPCRPGLAGLVLTGSRPRRLLAIPAGVPLPAYGSVPVPLVPVLDLDSSFLLCTSVPSSRIHFTCAARQPGGGEGSKEGCGRWRGYAGERESPLFPLLLPWPRGFLPACMHACTKDVFIASLNWESVENKAGSVSSCPRPGVSSRLSLAGPSSPLPDRQTDSMLMGSLLSLPASSGFFFRLCSSSRLHGQLLLGLGPSSARLPRPHNPRPKTSQQSITWEARCLPGLSSPTTYSPRA